MKKVLILYFCLFLHVEASANHSISAEEERRFAAATNIAPPFPSEAAQLYEQAFAALMFSRYKETIDLTEQGIALYNKTFANFPHRHYSVVREEKAEALHYLTSANNPDAPVAILDRRWASFHKLRAEAYTILYLENRFSPKNTELAEYLNEAERSLSAALKLAPANTKFLEERADMHIWRKNWDAAQADLQAALKHAHLVNNEVIRESILLNIEQDIAYVLIERGRLDEAEAICLRLQEKETDTRTADLLDLIELLRGNLDIDELHMRHMRKASLAPHSSLNKIVLRQLEHIEAMRSGSGRGQ